MFFLGADFGEPRPMGQGPWALYLGVLFFPIIPLCGPIIPLKGFYFAITGMFQV